MNAGAEIWKWQLPDAKRDGCRKDSDVQMFVIVYFIV
jgi:hypothetical protein